MRPLSLVGDFKKGANLTGGGLCSSYVKKSSSSPKEPQRGSCGGGKNRKSLTLIKSVIAGEIRGSRETGTVWQKNGAEVGRKGT